MINFQQVLATESDERSLAVLLPYIANPSAMTMVIESGRTRVLELLIEGGLDVNLSEWGESLVESAAAASHPEVVRVLLERGASVRGIPLVSAAYAGSLECVKLLVEAGADVDAGLKGFPTPLSTAIAFKHNDIEAYLRAHGATKLVGEGAPE